MNAPLDDNVLVFSSAGPAVPVSRLERSNEAKYKTGAEIGEFCATHNVPYVLDATSKVLPTQELIDLFNTHYPITRLPDLGLRHQGASTVIALESKNLDNPTSLHGHVMSAISGYVARKLGMVTDSVYIQADPELEYRLVFQKKFVDPLATLMKDQGAAVISSCVDWNDLSLDFDHTTRAKREKSLQTTESQYDLFWYTTAFAFTAAGNDGLCGPNGDIKVPFQKHMAFCHAPPLAASVGAVEWDEGSDKLTRGFYIAGYSSANGPTFLAPVAPLAKARWKENADAEAITGSSAAEPYAAGIFAALNKCFGPYLTREQILFAVIATCDKTVMVHKFDKQTPNDYSIIYKANAAGHTFNDGPGGFGMINPYKAYHVLAHMVALTQRDSDLISKPMEVWVEPPIPKNPENFAAKDGYYYYDIELPAGYALKTTIEAQFTNAPGKDVAHGQIRLTSPSGTDFAMTMSRSCTHGIFNGLSTSHGFTGEPTQGTWRVRSTQPISRLRISAHRFLEGDIVPQLDIKKLLATPLPYLPDAIPLVDLKPELRVMQKMPVQHRQPSGEGPSRPALGDMPHVQPGRAQQVAVAAV